MFVFDEHDSLTIDVFGSSKTIDVFVECSLEYDHIRAVSEKLRDDLFTEQKKAEVNTEPIQRYN